MKPRDLWRKIAKRTSNPDAWAVYKSLRNDVKREIRSAERAFAADQIASNPHHSSQLWKTIVSPVLKDDNHEEPNNNNPISLLPILSKVCETVALNQIMPYLTVNERLSTRQMVTRNRTLRKLPY